MIRTVPERDRITIEYVVAPSGRSCTPCSSDAVGDAGCGEEHVVARDEVVGRQHPLDVEPAVEQLLRARRRCAGYSRPWIAPPRHFSAAAATTPSGVPPIPSSMSMPDPPVVAAEIAPATSPSVMRKHPRADLADALDHLRVAVAVQDHHPDLLGPDALGLRHEPDVLLRRSGDVDRVGGLGAGRDLLHVDGGAGEEHRAALGQRDHRQRVRLADRGEAGPVDRVDGDVARRGRRRCRRPRRCRASAPRPSRPRRSRRRRPSRRCRASAASRRRRPGRRRSCRRARPTGPRRAPPPRSPGRAPAPGSGRVRSVIAPPGRRRILRLGLFLAGPGVRPTPRARG